MPTIQTRSSKMKGTILERKLRSAVWDQELALEVAGERCLNTRKKQRLPRILHAPLCRWLSHRRVAPLGLSVFWVRLASAYSKPAAGSSCSVKAEKIARKREGKMRERREKEEINEQKNRKEKKKKGSGATCPVGIGGFMGFVVLRVSTPLWRCIGFECFPRLGVGEHLFSGRVIFK